MTDDQRDLGLAREGDDEAFGRIYDRHAAVVLSLCRRSLTGTAATLAAAEDATQETFIRAHRMLDRLDDPERLRSWLYAIARRVCSERRRAARRRAHYEGDAMKLNGSIARTAAAGPTDASSHHEQLERLGSALDRLDERERLAIHLYYLDADPIRAASLSLGVSRSGYYKLLARARERLASVMQEAPTS